MKTEPTAPGRRAPEDAPPFNHGLALARILLCFLVVCCHAYRDGGVLDPLVLPLKKTAVPAFFSISCLLAAPAFEPGAGLRALSRRIARLGAPFLFWGLAFAVPFLAKELAYADSFAGGVRAGLGGIALQLLFGHAYDPPLWFLFDMIVFTLALHALARLSPSKAGLAALVVLAAALAFLLCQTGANHRIWDRFPWEVRYPFGRLCECFPYAAAGLLLGLFGIHRRMERHRAAWLAVLALALLLPSPPDPAHSFGNAGWSRLKDAAVLPCLFFLLPFGTAPGILKTAVSAVSRYTLGVYCIHYVPAILLLRILDRHGIRPDPIWPPLIVFAASWAACRLLAFFPRGRRFVS